MFTSQKEIREGKWQKVLLAIKQSKNMKYQFPVKGSYRISQNYGENMLNYDKLGIPGLTKHNGLDIAIPTGTPLLFPYDAIISDFVNTVPANTYNGGYGNIIRLLVNDNDSGVNYEWVMGHILPGFEAKVGQSIKGGEHLVSADNTGFSTGSHLHIGVRKVATGSDDSFQASKRILGKQYGIYNYNNGALGYIDPMIFFGQVEKEILPVDELYGQKRNWVGYLREKRAVGQFTRKINRLPTEREIKGLAYGYWDVEAILDEVMFQTWSNMHKPEFNKRLGK